MLKYIYIHVYIYIYIHIYIYIYKNNIIIIISLLSNYVKRKNCYDWPSANEPSGFDNNRCSPDAFVYEEHQLFASRILGGRKCDFAVRTARRWPVPCHSSSRFWHVGRCIVHRNVSCPAALRRDIFMGVGSTRVTLLTHRMKPNVVRESHV